MIPELIDGVLPVGTHTCTIEEVADFFGRFSGSDRRSHLTEKLIQYVAAARNSGIATAVIVDGSYITKKPEPNDIDLILLVRADFDLSAEMRPTEYNVQSKRAVRRRYGFDVLPAVEGSESYEEYLGLFSQIRPDDPEQATTRAAKGLLRIEL